MASGVRASVSLAVVKDAGGLRARRRAWREAGETVALVSTMGGIHEGHLALVRAAKNAAQRTVVSLFVNPLQFGAGEDFETYPRDASRDHAALEQAGVDLLFAPSHQTMLGEGMVTRVSVLGLTEGLCGPHRPGHFEGVVTIVTKLLMQCQPEFALFGEKDYQQLQTIRRLVRDLEIPVEILSVPTVRDADGLAVSSRNAHLSAQERRVAVELNRVLAEISHRLSSGPVPCGEAVAWGIERLEAAGFSAVDYLAVCDALTLEPVERIEAPARVLAAVRLGSTRLIDNMPIEPPSDRSG